MVFLMFIILVATWSTSLAAPATTKETKQVLYTINESKNETGYLVNGHIEVEGSYSFIAPDGNTYVFVYSAGEKGYFSKLTKVGAEKDLGLGIQPLLGLDEATPDTDKSGAVPECVLKSLCGKRK